MIGISGAGQLATRPRIGATSAGSVERTPL